MSGAKANPKLSQIPLDTQLKIALRSKIIQVLYLQVSSDAAGELTGSERKSGDWFCYNIYLLRMRELVFVAQLQCLVLKQTQRYSKLL